MKSYGKALAIKPDAADRLEQYRYLQNDAAGLRRRVLAPISLLEIPVSERIQFGEAAIGRKSSAGQGVQVRRKSNMEPCRHD